jgi:hypothetical protein
MKEFYIGRLKDGWSLSEIDDADFFYYLDLVAYEANQKDDACTIDEIF